MVRATHNLVPANGAADTAAPSTFYCDPARLRAERGHLLIFGHRGLPGDGQENRLESFQAAFDAGADGVEFDVHLAADGVPMVIHDPRLDRTTGKPGRVDDFEAADLESLGLPRLETVLAKLGPGTLTGKAILNVEFRDFSLGNRGLEQKVAELVRAHGAEDRVVFSSFNPLSLARVRHHSRRFYAAQLTSPSGMGSAMRLGYLWQPRAVHPHFAEVTEKKLHAWRGHGVRVVLWGADTEEQLAAALGWDIDGIITDRPAEAVELQRRGKGQPRIPPG